MVRSLYSKLSLALLVLFTFVGIVFIVVTFFSAEMYHLEVSQKLYGNLARNIVAEKILIQDRRVSEEALKEIFHTLMIINPAIEVYLLDPEGNILTFSADPGEVKRKSINLEPIGKLLTGDMTFPLLGDDPRDPSGEKIFSAARIPEQGALQGYLYIILGGKQYDKALSKLQSSYILRLANRLIWVGLVFGLLVGLVVFSLLTGRLKKLTMVMNSFKQGEKLQDIPLSGACRRGAEGDEIDELALTFQVMADRIADQIEKLKKQDLLRRELVANVSHDLQTPLATLTAYIETLQLKENNFTPEQRRKYLQTAQKHCNRLNTLVARLFELARLDDEESKPHREIFNISELVQDVVQNYELHAGEKGVSLSTNAGQDLPFVLADIGQIERVLENLLSNSIRHTPAGGSVNVILEKEDSHLLVMVRDTGEGIPPETLPHIFERFYRPGSGEEAKPSRSGLGLAIAKRIMEMHGSTLEVQSELHAGSCFSFRLPIASPA
jgi:two-component system OmpR family sensor kinase